MKYKVGSLFAGVGGLCRGIEAAQDGDYGFELIWANEIDEYACETYRKNHNHTMLEGDINLVLDPTQAKEQEEYDNIEEYFNSLTLLQKRELLEKVYSKIVIDTISNARFGPKRLRLKEIVFNQYSSVYGLCKILGVQDFHEFNEYLKTKGRQELNLLERYFGDAEEYIAETQKHNHSIKFKQYFKELDAVKDNYNDEFIEELIDECLEKTGQISEMTLDKIIQDFDKTYEEFKFKHFLKKVLQNEKALT